ADAGVPYLATLNMMDVAKRKGKQIRIDALQDKLGVPVFPVVARSGKGCAALLNAKLPITIPASPLVTFEHDIEEHILAVSAFLPESLPVAKRFFAIQLLLQNDHIAHYITENFKDGAERINRIADYVRNTEENGQSLKNKMELSRAEQLDALALELEDRSSIMPKQWQQTVDRFVTHPFFGVPIFLLTLFLIFKITFDWVGGPLSDLLDVFLNETIAGYTESFLVFVGAEPFLIDLVLNGIIAGVGGVLVFVPQIFVLFFFLSILEDSGYMARIAFLMDRLMEWAGLNGKTFIPMIIGFGCNVPGIMAARSIEQKRDRLLTILTIPFMSCSARLSVYSLFTLIFFPDHAALVVLGLYLLGVIVALLVAKVYTLTYLKEEESFFFVDLPAYNFPHTRTLLRSTWDKGKGFVSKAGTFIFAGSVVIWFLSYAGPKGLDVPMDDSFLAIIGGWIAPLLTPLGFDTWQAGASLITGFLAKEVVVSTMNIIYHAPDMDALEGVIANAFTTESALSFLVFTLLYIPCLATVGVIRKETNSWKWTFVSIGISLGIAYVCALLTYWVATMLI
ncbi:MAG: ferrous iron transport protein B, partial [Bacilli bacterium]